MDRLPPDVLAVVFDHLDAATCLRSRRVCREWRSHVASGCAHFAVSRKAFRQRKRRIGRITLNGHRDEPVVNATIANNDFGDADVQKQQSSNRLKGHLPQPHVIPSTLVCASEDPLHVIPTRSGAALRIQFGSPCSSLNKFMESIDLSHPDSAHELATVQKEHTTCPTSSPGYVVMDKTRPLKRFLVEVDLSCIRRLERLSVRGCSSLKVLRLPPSLVALDAHACTVLQKIYMPSSVDDCGLQMLTLNGCRSLLPAQRGELFGSETTKVMRHVRELDMSSALKIPKMEIATCLLSTVCLVSFSLRYVATDEILFGLAKSASVKTLRFVDVAFSTNLNDSPVDELVQVASLLERLNLRGCKSVSAACYNSVPIELANRHSRRVHGSTNGFEQEQFPIGQGRITCLKRKGDNLFHFAAHGRPSKRATSKNR